MNAMEAQPRYFTEEMDVTQGNLAMGFRLGSCMEEPDEAAIRVFNAVYGGCPTSKLFANVRERLSLCYYASSSVDIHKGLLCVSSGIDFDKYDPAREEILSQLEAMRRGAEQKNIRLTVTEGYISFDEQQKRYEKNLAPYLNSPDYTPVRAQAAAQRIVPEAGCCEAQTGLLVLFDVTDPRTKQFIERECVRYGFIQRYAENKEDITHMQQNPSAYRYVGKEDAEKMRAFDMCLEEYADYVASQHSATLE